MALKGVIHHWQDGLLLKRGCLCSTKAIIIIFLKLCYMIRENREKGLWCSRKGRKTQMPIMQWARSDCERRYNKYCSFNKSSGAVKILLLTNKQGYIGAGNSKRVHIFIYIYYQHRINNSGWKKPLKVLFLARSSDQKHYKPKKHAKKYSCFIYLGGKFREEQARQVACIKFITRSANMTPLHLKYQTAN